MGGRADDEVDPNVTGALFIVLAFAAMWAVIILPQQRRARRHRDLVASLAAGDEVVTAGGIVGTVTALDGDDLVLETAPGIHLRLVRAAVAERRDVPSPGGASYPAVDEDAPTTVPAEPGDQREG